MTNKPERLPNIHPGGVLLAEWLIPLGLTPETLAAKLGIDLETMLELMAELRDVTPELAAALSRGTGCSVEFWLNLQALYDAEEAKDCAR